MEAIEHQSIIWLELHGRLKALMSQKRYEHDFVNRLTQIETQARQAIDENGDKSLFVLVQMLFEKNLSYSATHALLSAALCRLIAPFTDISDQDQTSLLCAALTMNIGMTHLHDKLALQKMALTSEQRHTILSHPTRGKTLLQNLGVEDATWLRLVQDHHETSNGTGYPAGKDNLDEATRLLQMADVYIGSISPRHNRPGLLPQHGARKIYRDAGATPHSLGAAFVKAVGIYIPGSFVKLANGVIGIVMQRGKNAHTPQVASILGLRGAPIEKPLLIDTSNPNYEITGSVSADDVRLRMSWAELLEKFKQAPST